MKAKEYIRTIVDEGTREDMEALSDMLISLLHKVKEMDEKCYHKYKMKLYTLANGEYLTEELARDIVTRMKPYGEHWTIEQTTEVQNKNNLSNLNSVDFWTVMNMAYNDYHAMFGEDLNSYINFTKLFITDEDSGENKVFRYFTEII